MGQQSGTLDGMSVAADFDEEERPPAFWEWMGRQHLNADPMRAAAAIHVKSRWDLGPWYRNNEALRALEGENSEHAQGLRLLTQDYAEQFDKSARDQMAERLGAISPLVQVFREQCSKCTADALPGAGVCSKHGGSWITEEERANVSAAIQERLVGLSVRAVSVLDDLMTNAKSEKVRYDAAVAILDRSGLGAVQKVEVSVTETAESAASEIRGRLISLQERAKDATVPGEVVNGESA